ncbi:GAF domain-containing sensor histidine kinase [Jiulongibacter sp. NS-SX5]|uniref:GAF domain-containing sensor histidine kinase n=1 Tax=Jiulongibacter sp. NS-SX5 TaxID=3463854 RepID=UPI004057EC90
MIKPQKPANEEFRLKTLHELNILHSEEEKEYNDIAELASFICKTPVALVTLVGEEEQWFKAKVGTELTSTPREIAFCSHAIQDNDVLIVPNALEDERFVKNPLVTGNPDIRFYAGIPIRIKEQSLGTLCVIDQKPNSLDESQLNALKMLSSQVEKLLELRRASKELMKVSEENKRFLEGEIFEKNIQLRRQKEELQNLNDELEQMVYIASHDLKEPVRKIKMYSDILRNDTMLTEKQSTILNKINTSAERAHTLVQDVLDFATLQNDLERYTTVSLEKVFESILQSFESVIKGTDANFIFQELPTVKGDQGQLTQLFSNLIENSLKYNKNTPEIRVSAEVLCGDTEIGLEPEVQYHKITLVDNGIGFNDDHKEKIFEFFRRLHSKSDFEGTGIGLAIVKKVAQNHKGTVTAEGIPDQGSVFSVYLPV